MKIFFPSLSAIMRVSGREAGSTIRQWMGKNISLPLTPYKKYVQWEKLRRVQPQPPYLEVFCLEFFSCTFVCRLVIIANYFCNGKLKNYKNIYQ